MEASIARAVSLWHEFSDLATTRLGISYVPSLSSLPRLLLLTC